MQATYLDVGHKKLDSRIFRERERVWDLGAPFSFAEMPVANGWEADWIWSGRIDEALELFDQGDCSSVDVWTDASAGFEWSGEGGRKEGEAKEQGLRVHDECKGM
jgi:hypothetical protein